MEPCIAIQSQDFDPAAETTALHARNPTVGAVVSFVGLVRDTNDGGSVTRLEIEHYPGMAEKEIARIVAEAGIRWSLEAVRVIHRTGCLYPADRIVYVGVASQHRGEAFRACEFIMDYLKTEAPFWKKEIRSDGESWLATRASDHAKSAGWEAETR